MFFEIADSLIDNIIPRLEDADLSCLALTCVGAKRFCLPEIIKRAFENKNKLEAAALLIRKIDTFLERHTPIITKIRKVLEHFNDTLPFDFLPYLSYPSTSPCMELIENSIQKGLRSLEASEQKDEFYTQLTIDQEKQKVILHCIEYLEKFEMKNTWSPGPPPYIYIDTNQSSLSIGNLACFSTACKQLDGNKEQLSFTDSIFRGMNYYNNKGHKTITLFAPKTQDRELSEVLQNQLKTNLGLLKELRLLELSVQNYHPRIRSCYLSLLAETSNLPRLKVLYFRFNHEISDLHIKDLSDYFKKRLVHDQLSLKTICLYFWDITLEQIATLITNLDTVTTTPIDLSVDVRGRTFKHLEEIKANVDSLSTPQVEFTLRIIV